MLRPILSGAAGMWHTRVYVTCCGILAGHLGAQHVGQRDAIIRENTPSTISKLGPRWTADRPLHSRREAWSFVIVRMRLDKL